MVSASVKGIRKENGKSPQENLKWGHEESDTTRMTEQIAWFTKWKETQFQGRVAGLLGEMIK